mmetsp:Transcript_20510/g.32985  ORF Transcript_20510/g.32985 Transcript_20510/m.32985 type:complete len:381 (+) Transcript_20510:80-1222(+)
MLRPRRSWHYVAVAAVFYGILSSTVCFAITDATSSSTLSSSIPRSSDRHSSSYGDLTRFPPWNLSPQIDDHGFLIPKYQRIPGEWEKEVKLRKKDQLHPSHYSPATIRQVPGDGNCLFHSISTCLSYAVNGTHIDLRSPETMQWLYQHSTNLRQLAVNCLEERRKLLFLQGHEYLKARDLVEAAASQYGITGKEYCRLMRQDSYWGGGPEIVALCNVLQRPIHVYELHVPEPRSSSRRRKGGKNERGGAGRNGISRASARGSDISMDDSSSTAPSSFVLRRMACFGSPKFDKSPALHILSADSRFPDIAPGKQLSSGNHFLAIFPEPVSKSHQHPQEEDEKKQRIRGGDDSRRERYESIDDDEEEELMSWWRRLKHYWSS